MSITPHKHIKLIRLRTLRMVRGSSSGDHVSQRASSTGFEFDSLRMYEQGDDVRRIDWNSSVRVGSLMVRSFSEQHNRTIILMLDISASMNSGSCDELKTHLMQIIAHSISHAAVASRDAVGLCLTMNDRVIEYIPPRAGKMHSMHCRETLEKALDSLKNQQHNQAKTMHVVFPRYAWIILITDGLIPEYEAWWRTLSSRNFLTIVRTRDRYEKNILSGCAIACHDPEQPQAASRVLSASLQDHVTAWYGKQHAYAQKVGVALVDVVAGEPYEHIIQNFFERGIATRP